MASVGSVTLATHDRALRRWKFPRKALDWTAGRDLFVDACCEVALPRSQLAESFSAPQGWASRPRPQACSRMSVRST